MVLAQAASTYNGFYTPYPGAGYGSWRSFAYYFYAFTFWRHRLEQGAAMTRRATD